MKFGLRLGLAVAVFIITFTPASFAQVQVQVFSIPSVQEVRTNRAAQIADPNSSGTGILVSGSVLANAELTTTKLLITFQSLSLHRTRHPQILAAAIDGGVLVALGAATSNTLAHRLPASMVPTSVALTITSTTTVGSYQATINYDKNIVNVLAAGVTGGTGVGFTGVPSTVNIAQLNGSLSHGHQRR